MKISKKNSENINNLNILFTIMIVFMHATNVKNYVFQSNLISNSIVVFQKNMMNYVLAVAVPGFFLISGFLFYNGLTDNKIIVKMKKRISTLFIPYIVWNVIAYVYFYITSNIFKDIVNIATINFNIYDFIESTILFKYSPVNWYLFQLLIYVALSPIIYKLLKQKKGAFCFILVLIFVILNVNNDLLNTNSFSPCIRVDGLFYYSLGAIFALHFENFNILNIFNGYKLLCVFFFGILIIELHYKVNINIFPFGILFIFLFFRNITFNTSIHKLNRLISPFMMYQMHEFILEPIEKVFLLIFGSHYSFALIDYVFAPLIAIFIIIVLTNIVKSKFPENINLILWGGRV